MVEDNFQEEREALSQYEQIYGAKLNLSKSTIVVMGDHPFLDWLNLTGCWVVQRGEVVRYLSSPIGV